MLQYKKFHFERELDSNQRPSITQNNSKLNLILYRCLIPYIFTAFRFKARHVHNIALGNAGRPGKPELCGQLRTTVIGHR